MGLFSSKQDSNVVIHNSVNNTTNRREGETYKQWGVRWAGQTGAAIVALRPALQVVVCQQKKEQQGDEELQRNARLQKAQNITNLRADIDVENCKIDSLQNEAAELHNKIEAKKTEIAEIRGGNNRNRIAKINFWIGCLITILLATYLFIFYSSASYSAFFRKGHDLNVGNALFYPNAFADSWNESLGSFLLILLMPVIFLGLGFLVHQFSSRVSDSKNILMLIGKYLKIFILYVITFIFDALLAYEISKKIYDIWVMTQPGDFPPYTIPMAIESPEFWIIIFAGFIAYIIWGLVFDFTMELYADMTENKSILNRLNNDIKELNKQLDRINERIAQSNSLIMRFNGEIRTIEQELENSTTIDVLRIERKLNNFMSGWLAYMNLRAMPEEQQREANKVLEEMIEQIKN